MNKNIIVTSMGNVSYFEVNPEQASTIFFIHGNSGSGLCWKYQLNSPSLSEYRMIAIDLPGHGSSDQPVDAIQTYSPVGTAKILAEVMRQLKPSGSFILVGWSYGANLIGELLGLDIIPSGIVLVAPSIIGRNVSMEKMLIDPANSIYFKTGLSREEVTGFLEKQMDKNAEIFEAIADDYMKTDNNFRPILFKNAIEQNYSDEIAMLDKFKGPVLVVFGNEDKLVNSDYLDNQPVNFWRGRVCELEGEGHYFAFEHPQKFNSILAEYLEDLNDTIPDSKS
jgi:pimeloyl-ACP methyl ester carboxylesterase